MTGAQLVTYVSSDLLRDPSNETYSATLVLDACIWGQREVGVLLHPSYVPEIVKTASNKTLTSGKYALTGITAGVLGGGAGVFNVQMYVAAGTGKWCRPILDPLELNNPNTTPSEYDPGFRIIDNSIVIYQGSGTTTAINLEYKEVPTDVANTSTVPTLAAWLHPLIAKAAEIYCRSTLDRNNELIAIAEKTFRNTIDNLNKRAGA